MGEVQVAPASKVKARRAAELSLRHLGLDGRGGSLVITTETPEGWGLGSSTSDVAAAILAVHRLLRITPSPDTVARLAIEAETAIDPLMHSGPPVLFGHRTGVVLERFERALPRLEVLGCNPAPRGGAVDTLDLALPMYTERQTRAFDGLRAQLRQAILRGDAGLLGEVTTASAIINQTHLPQVGLDEIRRLGEDAGAVGIQVAHSGRVVGLLFDATEPACLDRVAMAERLLADALPEAPRWRFAVGEPTAA
jgi:uncharacterized protein involved in propanediol utilization